ncbi:MAG TPA: hypothetical protein VFS00_03310, partial [Polyangiaceae bacterium]|nr:hypothetical protein [Polyangiaceae bacterium]
ADADGLLNAAHVEGALAEILAAFGAGHVRGSEGAAAGTHRTLRQAVLGSGRVLLLDAGVTGVSETRLRVYGDNDSVWVLFNASWNGSAWARDAPNLFAGGFRFSRVAFELLSEDSLAPTFADFTGKRTLRMNSAVTATFETQGAARETGRVGLQASNPSSAGASLSFGNAVTFRTRFATGPSSLTLARSDASNFAGSPNVYLVDGDGFGVYTYQSVGPSVSSYWYGTYTAVA